ncbi:MAG: nucleoside/nucleotide kinase family protein [Mycobacterium sp.]
MTGPPQSSDELTAAVLLVAADIDTLHDAGVGRVLIGVTGPPGAGKSTFAELLVTRISAAYVPMDGFHLSNAQLGRLGRRARKGAVDTFDVDGYVALLERIAAAQGDVYVPGFDRALEEPVAAAHVVPAAARVVITEGNYLGLAVPGWQAVRPLLHRLYYLDCPAALRRERLVARHIAGGRSRAAARAWVDEVDEPNAVLIAGTRAVCDRVFDIAQSTP